MKTGTNTKIIVSQYCGEQPKCTNRGLTIVGLCCDFRLGVLDLGLVDLVRLVLFALYYIVSPRYGVLHEGQFPAFLDVIPRVSLRTPDFHYIIPNLWGHTFENRILSPCHPLSVKVNFPKRKTI